MPSMAWITSTIFSTVKEFNTVLQAWDMTDWPQDLSWSVCLWGTWLGLTVWGSRLGNKPTLAILKERFYIEWFKQVLEDSISQLQLTIISFELQQPNLRWGQTCQHLLPGQAFWSIFLSLYPEHPCPRAPPCCLLPATVCWWQGSSWFVIVTVQALGQCVAQEYF